MPSESSGIAGVYTTLMGFNLIAGEKRPFGHTPLTTLKKLVADGEEHLPALFRDAYARPLGSHIAGLVTRLAADRPDILETLTGAIYQHGMSPHAASLNRFLAVISNLYRSFLDSAKRRALNLPLSETLPPLAMYQSDAASGPFTVTVETVAAMIGGTVGVVSMPAAMADHPFLYGCLAHETGGHDVLHADPKLLPEIRAGIYGLFPERSDAWLGTLWDYWMDEAASDVYGVLNIGPSFGLNLAALMAAFLSQMTGQKAKAPALRSASGADESGALDPHPTDLLRLAVIQGVVEQLAGLAPATRRQYVAALDTVAETCAARVSSVELSGFARVQSGKSLDFQNSFALDLMQSAARRVGAFIAGTSFAALDGRSIQDIETWDDADEAATQAIVSKLKTRSSIVGAGDDAQIIAGLTLSVFAEPKSYGDMTALANAALDDSFANDPYWGVPKRDRIVVKLGRKLPAPREAIDPLVQELIEHNALEDEATGGIGPEGLAAARISKALTPIPWPAQLAPKPRPEHRAPGEDAPLPKCDYVAITWTVDEANAMAAVLTPGYLAAPPSAHTGDNVWYHYAHNYAQHFAEHIRRGAPASRSRSLGRYLCTEIGGKRVLCFKSELHLAQDGHALPVRDLFRQIIRETGAKLVITTGTAGAIGGKLRLGDVVAATSARFDCKGMFKSEPFNGQTFSNTPKLASTYFALANDKLVAANASRLPAGQRMPRIFFDEPVFGQANTIVTTDIFAFDDAENTYRLQGLGSAVEMDDAVLGLVCAELGERAPNWLAIRNASDPQMPEETGGLTAEREEAAKIYKTYGYWTTVQSAIATWAAIAGHG